MQIVIQRVKNVSVTVERYVTGKIAARLLILKEIEGSDTMKIFNGCAPNKHNTLS